MQDAFVCLSSLTHAISKLPKNLIKRINTIIKHFPKELLELWFTAEDMICMFRKGGLSWISEEDTSKAFKNNLDSTFVYKNRIMGTFYYSFGYHFKGKPPYHNTFFMVNQHATENYFLELESYSATDCVLESIEDRNIALNFQDIEQSCAFHVEEETNENKDISHSGSKTCSIDIHRELTSAIVKHTKSCKKCGDIELI